MYAVHVRLPEDVGRLSFLFVLFGIAVLYAANSLYTAPSVAVETIDGERMGEMVQVRGIVSGIWQEDGNTFFTLQGERAQIRAVAFRPLSGLEEGVFYHITGRVDVYRGRPEIIVHAVSRSE